MERSLPQGWKVEISSKILDIRDGTHDTPKYVQDGIPLVTSKNLKGKDIDFSNTNKISQQDHFEISKRSKVAEGDILYAMIGTIGNPILIKGNANFSIKNVALFKKNEAEILPPFLLYYLGSRVFDQQLVDKKLLKGTTQKFIPLGSFRNLELPIPPINEQHQIVDKIEELFSELDKGIENLRTAQQQLKVYRQAVLQWAFEGKLTNENVKDGELPEGWELKELGHIVEKVFDGPFGSNLKSDDYVEGGVRVIRLENIGVLEFKDDYKTFVSDEKYSSLNKHTVYAGDIIFSSFIIEKVRVVILPSHIKCAVNKADCFCIRVGNSGIDKAFLAYFLSTKNVYNQLINEVHGATRPRINTRQLKSCLIPVCSIIEQEQIVQEIESRLSVCDKMEETIITSLQQAEALRQSILKRAFEGKLVITKSQIIDNQQLITVLDQNWKRKVLAGHIIYSFQTGGYIGRTKLQKILYLCEQHAELNYETNYIKEAAGPLDSKFLYPFLNEAKQENWIEETSISGGYKYEPSAAISKLTLDYPKYFRADSEKIKFVIKLLKDKDTDTSELIATIYAIWNNCLIEHRDLTNDVLVYEVYDWDASKYKFDKRLILSTWQWMKEEGLVPVGFGKLVIKAA